MDGDDVRAGEWTPAPPEKTPRMLAVELIEHELEKDAAAQLLEKNDWNPQVVGVLGDAMMEEMLAMPDATRSDAMWGVWGVYLSAFMPKAVGVPDGRLADVLGREDAERLAHERAAWRCGHLKFTAWCGVKAVRWVVERGFHPYFGAPGAWSVFDEGALIEDMGDDYSNVPNGVYKLMGGEAKSGHRVFTTGLEAMWSVIEALTRLYEQGSDPDAEPAEGEEGGAGDEPDDEPDDAYDDEP